MRHDLPRPLRICAERNEHLFTQENIHYRETHMRNLLTFASFNALVIFLGIFSFASLSQDASPFQEGLRAASDPSLEYQKTPSQRRETSVHSLSESHRTLEVGLKTESLFPNELPNFPEGSVGGIGPLIVLPIGGPGSLEISTLYAYGLSYACFLNSVDYLIRLQTPYFSNFVAAGPTLLLTRRYGVDTILPGLKLSGGFLLGVASGVEIKVGITSYIFSRTILGIGGSFGFLL